MATCQACRRKAESKGLCKYHKQAHDSLMQNYNAWCNAYGKLSRKEYLERLFELKETGSWVKDVIKLELQKT